jgi:antitoxin (DNA-binding transcriptional repressor) of toxin-antitoxin stability system
VVGNFSDRVWGETGDRYQRRVERGETLGVTDRGRLVAILAPPSAAGGVGALIAAGRVQPAQSTARDLPKPTAARRRTDDVLNELRDDS